MTTTIEKKFEVNEPIEKVWAYLTNPEKIVVCVPGASLTEKIDDRNYKGGVTLKLGPVKAKFAGAVNFEEVDEANRKMTLKGKGLDQKGKGSADMLMKSNLIQTANGTEVDCSMQISIVGKLAQFGARLINEVTEQIFNQFINNFKAKLAEDTSFATPANPTAAAEAIVDEVVPAKPLAKPSTDQTTEEKAAAVKASAAAVEKAVADVQAAQAALDQELSGTMNGAAAKIGEMIPKQPKPQKIEAGGDNSLNAFSLLWAVIKGWFSKLFGGGK